MSFGIEPLRVFEEVLAAHCGAVVYQDCEGVGRPLGAVGGFQSLGWLAGAEAYACGWPEAEGFFDNSEGVVQVVG